MKLHAVNKLDLGLSYIALTPEDEKPHDLLRLEIRVPVQGGVVAIPFSKVTPSQLEKAIELAQGKPTAHDGAAAARAKEIAPILQAAVAAPKGTHFHAPRTKVHPHADDRGKFRVSVNGIDLEDLPRVGIALAKVGRVLAKRYLPGPKKAGRGLGEATVLLTVMVNDDGTVSFSAA